MREDVVEAVHAEPERAEQRRGQRGAGVAPAAVPVVPVPIDFWNLCQWCWRNQIEYRPNCNVTYFLKVEVKQNTYNFLL